MSLVVATLFRHPPPKLTGRIYTFSSEKAAPNNSNARNEATKRAGVESVFNAIASGCQTVTLIVDYTGLCKATVNKALHDLEDWEGGARICRDTRENEHRFTIKEVPCS